eukprot:1143540-Pyramimonas_sp.AAC.2
MKHYQKEVVYDEWQRRGDRPLLYVNTFNHMMGPRDANTKCELNPLLTPPRPLLMSSRCCMLRGGKSQEPLSGLKLPSLAPLRALAEVRLLGEYNAEMINPRKHAHESFWNSSGVRALARTAR